MKTFLVALLFFFSAAAFAQNQTLIAAAEAACGPMDVQFEVHPSKEQPLTQPDPGKSLVYVIEEFDRAINEWVSPTLRMGLDGKWVGAVKGDSYLALSVDPGEHHLCTNWQSSVKRLSSKVAFTSLNAEPGKIYYFRARIIEGGQSFTIDFIPVDEDEGKYLVASAAPSDSHAKGSGKKAPPDQSSTKGN